MKRERSPRSVTVRPAIVPLTSSFIEAHVEELVALDVNAAPAQSVAAWSAEDFLDDRPDQGHFSVALLLYGEVVAYWIASLRETDWRSVFTHRVLVRPDVRGLKLARLMLETVCQRVARAHGPKLFTVCLPKIAPAREALKAMGFVAVNRQAARRIMGYEPRGADDVLAWRRAGDEKGGRARGGRLSGRRDDDT
jgi:GNAT superfamily N-acetyltransferase